MPISLQEKTFLQRPLLFYIITDIPRVVSSESLVEVGKAYRETKRNCIFIVTDQGALVSMLDDNAISWLAEASKDPNCTDAGHFVDFLKKNRAVSSVAVAQDALVWDVLWMMKGQNSEGRELDLIPVVEPTTKAPVGVISRNQLASALGASPAAA